MRLIYFDECIKYQLIRTLPRIYLKNPMIMFMKSDMTVYEIWVSLEEHLILLYRNNKSANQPAHPRSPYITFVGGSLESMRAKLVTLCQVSMF